ncbi:hypothetical protein N1851_004646 [Merluccius polli]|uniref:Uncharacterized protein n=1 Tax=Merluccius polli TaxID=89951 RepID=A0AA47N7Z9_MERPO|nr:hypothetical protein N1851_004646 [Merluccius polli]
MIRWCSTDLLVLELHFNIRPFSIPPLPEDSSHLDGEDAPCRLKSRGVKPFSQVERPWGQALQPGGEAMGSSPSARWRGYGVKPFSQVERPWGQALQPGEDAAHRVVFMKQLSSGLLLVTGKYNCYATVIL